MKLLPVLAFVLLTLIALGLVASSLAVETASTANAGALAASSSVLAASQCITGLVALLALGSGIGLGVLISRIRAPRKVASPTLAESPRVKVLPVAKSVLPVWEEPIEIDTGEVENILFKNWGGWES